MQRYVRQRELPATTKALQTVQRTSRAEGGAAQERQRRAGEHDDVDSQDFVSHRSPSRQRDEYERKLHLIVVIIRGA